MSTSILDLTLAYYDDINAKQFARSALRLTKDVELLSPLTHLHGKDAVTASMESSPALFLTIASKVASDNEVMLTYEIRFPEPTGSVKAAALFVFEKQLIKRIELYYDSKQVESL